MGFISPPATPKNTPNTLVKRDINGNVAVSSLVVNNILGVSATFSGSIISTNNSIIQFTYSKVLDGNDGKIGARTFAKGLNIVGIASEANDATRYTTIFGHTILDQGFTTYGTAYLNEGIIPKYIDIVDRGEWTIRFRSTEGTSDLGYIGTSGIAGDVSTNVLRIRGENGVALVQGGFTKLLTNSGGVTINGTLNTNIYSFFGQSQLYSDDGNNIVFKTHNNGTYAYTIAKPSGDWVIAGNLYTGNGLSIQGSTVFNDGGGTGVGLVTVRCFSDSTKDWSFKNVNGNFSIEKGSNGQGLTINAPVTLANSLVGYGDFTRTGSAGTDRSFIMTTNGSFRWTIGTDSSTENGSNSGSNFYINCHNDGGGYQGTPIYISRSSGLVSLNNGLNVFGNVYTYGSDAGIIIQDRAGGNSTWVTYANNGFYRWYNGSDRLLLGSTRFGPVSDNSVNSGDQYAAWANIYSRTAVQTTSDGRYKMSIEGEPLSKSNWKSSPMTEKEIEWGLELARNIGWYLWDHAIEAKGFDNARLHSGIAVQNVIQLAKEKNIDPFKYAFVCYDPPIENEDSNDEEDENIARKNGIFSLKGEEMNSFILRAIISKLDNTNKN